LANSATVGLINQSGARLRRVRPRVRAFHRSSIELPHNDETRYVTWENFLTVGTVGTGKIFFTENNKKK
jgi:hypothetical protein